MVTRLPLAQLDDAQADTRLVRKRPLGREQVAELLRQGPVRFVIASCGLPLVWVPLEDCYRFWKDEAKSHLVEPDVAETGFRLEDLPGAYAYMAAEWGETTWPVIVLEKAH